MTDNNRDDLTENPQPPAKGDEPWRRWTVKPILKPLPSTPPETGIGSRIAYCRAQLDNLSLDALARYTKFFDEEGVSRHSIFRYEGGKAIPGGRELRILCDTLWIPANWLLYGTLDETTSTGLGQELEEAINRHLEKLHVGGTHRIMNYFNARAATRELERRQKWIEEARKAQPR